MEFVKSYGGREKYFKRLNVKDCVVRAICNATDEDYKEIYDRMRNKLIAYNIQRGRFNNNKKNSPRNGFPNTLTRDFIEKNLGWKWNEVKAQIDEYPFPDGIYLVQMKHHVTCIKDHVLYDSWDCQKGKNKNISGYWSRS